MVLEVLTEFNLWENTQESNATRVIRGCSLLADGRRMAGEGGDKELRGMQDGAEEFKEVCMAGGGHRKH